MPHSKYAAPDSSLLSDKLLYKKFSEEIIEEDDDIESEQEEP